LINNSKKLVGPFLIDLKNKFREIAGDDQVIDKEEFLKWFRSIKSGDIQPTI